MIMIIDSDRSNTVIRLTNIFKNVYRKKKKKILTIFYIYNKNNVKIFLK